MIDRGAHRGHREARIVGQELGVDHRTIESRALYQRLFFSELIFRPNLVIVSALNTTETLIGPQCRAQYEFIAHAAGSVRNKLILRAALWAYERLGGVERADYHEVWSKDELAEKEPLIERSRLNGAVVYPEFLTDDSRLTVATVRSAVDHGATVATYLKATNIRKDQAFCVDAASTLPGENCEVTIQARA